MVTYVLLAMNVQKEEEVLLDILSKQPGRTFKHSP
jgi:hypothetical protein